MTLLETSGKGFFLLNTASTTTSPMRSRTELFCEVTFLAFVFFLPVAIGLSQVALVLSLISWGLLRLMKGSIRPEERTLLMLAGLLVLTSSVSAFYSGYLATSARGILKLLKFVLIMFVAADLFRDPAKMKRLIVVGVVALAIVIGDSLIQRFHGTDLFRGQGLHFADKQVRLTGPFRFYGLLGAFLIAMLPVILSFLLVVNRNQPWRNAAWFLLFCLTLYVLYKTHSRGAWLAAVASIGAYAWLVRSKLVLGAIVITVITAPFVLPKNALSHLDKFGREQTIIERNLLWSRAAQVIRARPFFGCGINTYIRNYEKYNTDKDWRLFNLRADAENYKTLPESERWRVPGHHTQIPSHYAHNGYLQIAAETGLFSLLLFFLLLARGIRSGGQALKRSAGKQKLLIAGLLTGFIALLLHAGVDTTLHNLQSASFIWLYLGLLLAVPYATREV